MRILHTSDWHLGQSLHQFERTFEHERFLSWLKETIKKEQVDVLLVAGDIFDTANPPVSAQRQLYNFLVETRREVPHLNFVFTAGNHDSPSRLEAPSAMMDFFGATVIGNVPRSESELTWDKIVIPLKNRAGEIRAWCIAMPFLRPNEVPRGEAGAAAENAYAAGVAGAYRQALDRALRLRQPGQAIVAIGHCHIASGRTSQDSERQILIGGAESLSVDIFDPAIAYVALGHLHLAQPIGGNPTRRYCGSPIPMSFSEVSYPHQVVIFDLEGEGVANLNEVRIPRAVELLNVPKEPASVDEALEELTNLNLPERPENEQPYLQARVQIFQPEPELRAKIEKALANKPVRLAKIEVTRPKAATSESHGEVAGSMDEFNSLSPEIFFQRIFKKNFGEEPSADFRAAFTELLNTASEREEKP